MLRLPFVTIRESDPKTQRYYMYIMRALRIIVTAMSAGLCILTIPTGKIQAKQTSLSGSWRGAGLVQDVEGQKERVKCRVRYENGGRQKFRVMMKCVSRTKGSKANSFTVTKSGNRAYSGQSRDDETNINVDASITLKGHKQIIELKSTQGWGRFEMVR